jgi:hypothetical protein
MFSVDILTAEMFPHTHTHTQGLCFWRFLTVCNKIFCSLKSYLDCCLDEFYFVFSNMCLYHKTLNYQCQLKLINFILPVPFIHLSSLYFRDVLVCGKRFLCRQWNMEIFLMYRWSRDINKGNVTVRRHYVDNLFWKRTSWNRFPLEKFM